MRRASVPVVGDLIFLASNSDIANDFIAFDDHLKFHSTEFQSTEFHSTSIPTQQHQMNQVHTPHNNRNTNQTLDTPFEIV